MQLNTIEQQVRELHEEGYSIRGIADYLDIDKSKVQRILKKLQENSETAVDTLGEAEYHKDDTTRDTLFGKGFNTGDTVSVSSFDTSIKQHMGGNSGIKQPLSVPKTYTLAETRLLMKQRQLLMEDIVDYVTEMIGLHDGQTAMEVQAYRRMARRGQRLIQSTQLLADQLEEDFENLLATQLLRSVQATTRVVISSGRRVDYPDGPHYDIKENDTQFWEDCLDADLFYPSI